MPVIGPKPLVDLAIVLLWNHRTQSPQNHLVKWVFEQGVKVLRKMIPAQRNSLADLGILV
ncbi:hypothetical protein [uncultured Corynebacterium sp.]|uniref:hypothetical protein n=1 Tax=uncultured Corynebacterium sp. TaxID=159447 RepID=UPI0025DF96F6|nr:hypothetical protein [uncultured Corynebacterium sp.]